MILLLIQFKIIYHNYFPNLQKINNNKDYIACNFTDHNTERILKNSYKFSYLFYQQNLININNQKYLSEAKSLLKYFYSIKNTNNMNPKYWNKYKYNSKIIYLQILKQKYFNCTSPPSCIFKLRSPSVPSIFPSKWI